MLTNEEKQYLDSLDNDQLLEQYKAALKCAHYCPVECHCQDEFDKRMSSRDLEDAVRKRMK